MMFILLLLSILAGQLVKIPVGTHGGATLLDVTVALLCLMGTVKIKFHLKKPPLFIKAAAIFILISLISLILSPLRLTTIEYITSFSYIVRFSSYILLGWLICLQVFPTLSKDISLLTFSGIGLAVLGLLQLIFLPDLRFLTKFGWDPHYFRTVSTFLDPNFAGAYFSLTLILLIQNLAIAKKWNIFIFALVYIALLTTFSRGAYLAFGASFLSLSVLNKSFRLFVLSLTLLMGLFLGFNTYQKLVAQVRNIDRQQSAQFRLSTWQQGWEVFSHSPILGVGFNSYRYALKEYYLAEEKFLQSHGASTNDSSLLFVTSTTGILGLTSYLFFLFSLARTAWRNYLQKNKWGIILLAGLAGLVTQSFFANTLFYPSILIWIILVTATQKK